MSLHKLYARAGWGSVLVESQLAWYGLEHELIEVADLFQSATARQALSELNPLAQIPTLVLPDESILTESAAITLYLADCNSATPSADSLVPQALGYQRNAFLRWLIFVVANIYPTFTYADDPSRFVSVVEAQQPFKAALDDYAQKLYRQLDGAAGSPWFLGAQFSALDLYVCTLTHWRPGTDWFRAEAPALYRIAQAAKERPELTAVWQRNFPSRGDDE